jgi:hypothetical protein
MEPLEPSLVSWTADIVAKVMRSLNLAKSRACSQARESSMTLHTCASREGIWADEP